MSRTAEPGIAEAGACEVRGKERMTIKHAGGQSLAAELEHQRGLVQIALAALRKASTMGQLEHGTKDWYDALVEVNKAIETLTRG